MLFDDGCRREPRRRLGWSTMETAGAAEKGATSPIVVADGDGVAGDGGGDRRRRLKMGVAGGAMKNKGEGEGGAT